MTAVPAIPDRLGELLADRALVGLGPDETAELDALVAEHPELDEPALVSFDAAAAALSVAFAATDHGSVPAGVLDRLRGDAQQWTHHDEVADDAVGAAHAVHAPAGRIAPAPASDRAWSLFRTAPWLLAAASLLLAVLAWMPGGPAVIPAVSGTDAVVRAVEADPAATRIAWSSPVGLEVDGGIVWSDARQAGFMRFRGLDVNDPTETQYQLWIFDKARTRFQAVDGGVFDVDRATGEVIVPISAKLDVGDPFLFAVTTEPPGGVVVHDPALDPERYRIILTAPVPAPDAAPDASSGDAPAGN